MSVFVGTNPHDLITEDWDIARWSSSNGLLVEDLVDWLSKTLAYNIDDVIDTFKNKCYRRIAL